MKKLLTSLILLSIMSLTFIACEEKSKPIKRYTKNDLFESAKYVHYKKSDMDPRLKRYPKAVMFYEEAGSDPSSAFDLALFYEDTLKDYNEAIIWYTRAYEKDYFKAAHNMAISYTSLKDYENAIKWYKISISKGITDSYFNLGLLYENTIKDKEQALKYYKLDTKLGTVDSIESIENLTVFYSKQKDYVTSTAYYFAIAAILNNKDELLKYLRNDLKYSEETIKKGYELQLTMPGLIKRYKGGI